MLGERLKFLVSNDCEACSVAYIWRLLASSDLLNFSSYRLPFTPILILELELSSTIYPDIDSGIGLFLLFHCSIVLSTTSSPTMLPILTSLLRGFLHLTMLPILTSLLRGFFHLAPPVEKAPPLGSNALSWEGFSLWLHFIVLVTSLLRRFLPLVAPVEKATSLGSNASCDDPSPMPSSGESREQSEAEAGS